MLGAEPRRNLIGLEQPWPDRSLSMQGFQRLGRGAWSSCALFDLKLEWNRLCHYDESESLDTAGGLQRLLIRE